MNKYPFKLSGANINRKLFAVGSPALDITQTASKAVSGVTYNFRGAWSLTLNCVLGDTVLYGTTMWLATAASAGVAPGNGLAQWQSLGSYSAFQGTWSATTGYVMGDEVVYSGNFWLALAANTNSAPTISNANWQIAGPTSLDNVADGTTYTRTLSLVQTGNVPDLSKGILNKNLTYITDGTTELSIGTGNGTTTSFTLPAGWQAGAAVYKSDWQGNQLQYSTPRTNWLEQSNALGTSPWNTGGNFTSITTVVVNGQTLNQLNSPGGEFTDTIQTLSTPLPANSYLTLYAIAASGTSTQTAIRVDDGTPNNHTTWPINWSGGIPSGGGVGQVGNLNVTSNTITNLGGGLYKISLTVLNQTGAAVTPHCGLYENWTTGVSGTPEYAIWGDAQVELVQVAGDYIPTTTSPVTVTDYTLSPTQITFAPAPVNLAALTALVGRSAVANGPGLQGVLAVDPYSRALIDTAQSGHLNQWQYQYMASQVQGAVGSTADVNGNYILGFSTSQGTDDAGWSNTAIFGDVSLTPTTLGGYGITNGQPALGNAAGEQILYQQSGGGPYWGNKYGTEFNYGDDHQYGTPYLSTNTTTWTQIGNQIYIPNPQQAISIVVLAAAQAYWGGTAGFGAARVGISTDGGNTFNYSNSQFVGLTAADSQSSANSSVSSLNVVPTGDIYVVQQVKSDGAYTVNWQSSDLTAWVMPQSNFARIGPSLSVTVPATSTANCTATYPTTTCAAISAITAVATGGKPAYSYSWTRTGGTGAGTITSGATSATVNVSCTETATSGGASFTDTYKCVVTDSLSATANGSCTVTSTFTLTYPPIAPSLSVTNAACANTISGNPCTATGKFTASATGGNQNYTYSNSIYSYDSGFTTNPTIVTGATSATGTYSGAAPTASGGNKKKVTLKTTINDTRGTGAESITNFGYLTFNFV